MDILLVVLRLIHIVAAFAWFGVGGFMTLYVMPTAIAQGQEGFRFLKSLFVQSAYARLVASLGGITVLAGILLYLVGNASTHFTQTGNIVLGIGALAGFLAVIHGGAVTGRATRALENGMSAIPEGNGPIPAATLSQINELAVKLLGHARLSFVLTLIALVGMGSARYL